MARNSAISPAPMLAPTTANTSSGEPSMPASASAAIMSTTATLEYAAQVNNADISNTSSGNALSAVSKSAGGASASGATDWRNNWMASKIKPSPRKMPPSWRRRQLALRRCKPSPMHSNNGGRNDKSKYNTRAAIAEPKSAPRMTVTAVAKVSKPPVTSEVVSRIAAVALCNTVAANTPAANARRREPVAPETSEPMRPE